MLSSDQRGSLGHSAAGVPRRGMLEAPAGQACKIKEVRRDAMSTVPWPALRAWRSSGPRLPLAGSAAATLRQCLPATFSFHLLLPLGFWHRLHRLNAMAACKSKFAGNLLAVCSRARKCHMRHRPSSAHVGQHGEQVARKLSTLNRHPQIPRSQPRCPLPRVRHSLAYVFWADLDGPQKSRMESRRGPYGRTCAADRSQ